MNLQIRVTLVGSLLVSGFGVLAQVTDTVAFETPGTDAFQSTVLLTSSAAVKEANIALSITRPVTEFLRIRASRAVTVQIITPSGQSATRETPLGFVFETTNGPGPLNLDMVNSVGETTIIIPPVNRPGGRYTVRLTLTSSSTSLVTIGYFSSGPLAAIPIIDADHVGDPASLKLFLTNGDAPVTGATIRADVIQSQKDDTSTVVITPAGSTAEGELTRYRYAIALAPGSGPLAPLLFRITFQAKSNANFQIVDNIIPVPFVAGAGSNAAYADLELLSATPPDLSALEWTVRRDVVITQLQLADSGPSAGVVNDGLYGIDFTPASPGRLSVIFTITGISIGGVPGERHAFAERNLNARKASLQSVDASFVDDNTNGLKDRLRLRFQVNVVEPGGYSLSLSLVGSTNKIYGVASADLTAGIRELVVEFSAKELLRLSPGGAYSIKDVALFHGDSYVPTDERSEMGSPVLIDATQLDRGMTYFTGLVTSSGVGSVSGGFETLRVSLGVFASAGQCTWSGTLNDEQGSEIATASGQAALLQGPNTVNLDFEGFRIRNAGRPGPWKLKDVAIRCDDGIENDLGETLITGFSPSQFGAVQPDFAVVLDPPIPSSVGLLPGTSVSLGYRIDTKGGLSGVATAVVDGAPPGLTVQVPEVYAPTIGDVIEVSLASGAPSGSHLLTLRVRIGGREKSVPIIVLAGQKASVTMTPSFLQLAPGESRQLTATVTGVADTRVRWEVFPEGRGTVSTTGLFRAPADARPGERVQVVAYSVADGAAGGAAEIEFLPAAGVVPSSGVGNSQIFRIVAFDSAGAEAITGIDVVFNATHDGGDGCSIQLLAGGQIRLRTSIASSEFLAGTLGQANVISNDQCSIDLAASNAATSFAEKTATLTLKMGFKPWFAGTWKVFVRSASNGQLGAWTNPGGATWTVPSVAGTLPRPWLSQVVGPSAQGNSVSFNAGAFTVGAQGGSIWGNTDSFHFVHQPLTGNATIVARLASVITPYYGDRFGIMIRESLVPNSPNVFVGIQDWNQLQVQWRAATGGDTAQTLGAIIGPNYWLKLVREGNTFTAFGSVNGVDWERIGTPQTVAMSAAAFVGIAVASNDPNQVRTGVFDHLFASSQPDFYLTSVPLSWTSSTAGDSASYFVGVNSVNGFTGAVSLSAVGLPARATFVANPSTVTGIGSSLLSVNVAPGTQAAAYPFAIRATSGATTRSVDASVTVSPGAVGTLPAGWSSVAIGTTEPDNSAQFANGAFTLRARSGTIWDNWDSHQFAYQPVTGDFSITARLTAIQNAYWNDRFGIMIRDGLSPSSPNVFLGVRDFGTLVAQSRSTLNGWTTGTDGPVVGTPYWIRLTRVGNQVSAQGSADGRAWTQIGTPRTVTMGPTVNAGLAVASADFNGMRSAVFDNVTVSTTPTTGGSFAIAGPADAISVTAGAAASWTYSVVPSGGFNSQVAFSVSGLPAGASATFSPQSVAATGVSTLNLTTGVNTPTGSHALTVTATSGSTVRTVVTTLMVTDSSSQAPVAVSVSPASGSGASQLFSFVASSPSGAATISWTQSLFAVGISASNSCYVHFDQASGTVYLRDDSQPSWAGSGAIGAAEVLNNSQCQIDLAASSTQATGNTLTVNLKINFKPSFAGTKGVFLLVGDDNTNSGWSSLDGASWNVPVPANALPAGWTASPVGTTQGGNDAQFSNGAFTVSSQGGTIWNDFDSFQFVNTSFVGDGTIIARMTSLQDPYWGDRFGIMVREGPTPTGANVFVGIQDFNKLEFQWRSTLGGATNQLLGPDISAPIWLKMTRQANVFSAFYSADGLNWIPVGSPQTVALPRQAYAGLAVAANDYNYVRGATFDSVVASNQPDFYLTLLPASWTSSTAGGSATYSVGVAGINGFTGTVGFAASGLPAGATSSWLPASISANGISTMTLTTRAGSPPGSYPVTITGTSGSISRTAKTTLSVASGSSGNLPTGWNTVAIGANGPGSSATFANGAFAVNAENDVTGDTADALEFVFQPLTGDGEITARLTGIENAYWYSKFGVMIRESLHPSAANVFTGVWHWATLTQSWRSSAGLWSENLSGPPVGPPYWIRLVRQGSVITSFGSADGVSWSQIGNPQTVALGATAYIGLAVSSFSPAVRTGSFDNVTVVSRGGGDFGIAVSPASTTVMQTRTSTFTVDVVPVNNYSSATTLSVGNLPPGVTGTFSPNVLNGPGQSTLTVSAGPNAQVGSFPIVVTATGNGLARNSVVGLIVNPFDNGGTPTSGTITVTPDAGSGGAQLFEFVGNHPSGPGNFVAFQVTFNTSSSGDGGCMLYYDAVNQAIYIKDDQSYLWSGGTWLGAAETIENAKCSLDAGASSASIAQGSITLRLALRFKPGFQGSQTIFGWTEDMSGGTVGWLPIGSWTMPGGSAGDFTMSALPTSVGLTPGNTTSVVLNIASVGSFAGSVSLSALPGLPQGTTVAFLPAATVAPGSVTMSISTSSNTPEGTYPITVVGAGGGIQRAVPISLNVSQTVDFYLSSTPSSQAVAQGVAATFVVGVSGSGSFNQPVSCQPAGLPSGLTYNISPASVMGSGSLVLTISGTQNGALGVYPFSLNCTSGSMNRTLPLSLTIGRAGGDFALELPAGNQLMTAGMSNTFVVRLTPLYGFSQAVDLSVTGLPQGATALFTPTRLIGSGVSGLAISLPANLAPGYYPVTVRGTAGTLVNSATLGLAVNGDFTLAISDQANTISAGESTSYAVSVSSLQGFSGNVAFSVSDLPPGTSVSFAPPTVRGSGQTVMTLTTSASTPAGAFAVKVQGASGGLVHDDIANLVVLAANTQAPSAVSVTPNQGNGATQMFSFTATDPANATNISWAEVLFSTGLNGVGACYIHFDRESGTLYLRDDSNPGWAAVGAIGTPGALQNSQCMVDTAASSASVAGTTLTLNLSLTFAPSFAGAKDVSMIVGTAQLNSGWSALGGATWTVPGLQNPLPTGWTRAGVGSNSNGNTASFANGTFTVGAQSGTIWSWTDSFHFVYTPLAGNGSIVARITGVQNPYWGSRFGIMIREGPTPTGANVFVGIQDFNQIDYQWRSSLGAETAQALGGSVSPPSWLKLVRQGNVFTAFTSSDGANWSQVGSTQTIPMGSTVYAGLAVASNDMGSPRSATFDSVAVVSGQ